MYRYIGNTGRRYRVEERVMPSASAPPEQQPAPQRHQNMMRPPQASPFGGLEGVIRSILPAGMDAGDLMFLVLLLLLYMDSRDEEFLIILAVVAMSIFGRG